MNALRFRLARLGPRSLFLLFLACAFACKPADESLTLKGYALGTTYTVKIYPHEVSEDEASLPPEDELRSEIEDVIAGMNAAMSNWHTDSEISRFNALEAPATIEISPAFARVLEASQEMHRRSGGAFDPGRSRLFDLWGFGAEQKEDAVRSVPDQADIERLLQNSGLAYVRLEIKPHPENLDSHSLITLHKERDDAGLNVSALAKGYAVDLVFERLQEHGARYMMVEIGGEVRTGPAHPQRGGFHIGIDEPRYDGRRSLYEVLEVSDAAVATSGNYRNYFRGDDGRLYSHILDPRTGRPSESDVVSATVIGPACMIADALATTLLVLSEDEGLALIEAMPEYEALLLIKDGEKLREVQTAGMARFRNGSGP